MRVRRLDATFDEHEIVLKVVDDSIGMTSLRRVIGPAFAHAVSADRAITSTRERATPHRQWFVVDDQKSQIVRLPWACESASGSRGRVICPTAA